MFLRNLIENTEGSAGCGCEHGLSFYIETRGHKLLVDTGASSLLLENAEKLGVDLTQVDTVILSHGHYDHGGGIPGFVSLNPDAKIYLQPTAFGDYCSVREGAEPRYIGLDPSIRDLPQVIPVTGSDGLLRIDDELTLFWDIGSAHPIPSGNRTLKIRKRSTDGATGGRDAGDAGPGADGGASQPAFAQDDFRHEQCLVIRQEGLSILLCGCAHHGILNILDRYEELFGEAPDVVISGFHMMQRGGYSEEDIDLIIDTALSLKKEYPDTRFYTCHCTGVEPYEAMRQILGERLTYVHCGDGCVLPDDHADRISQKVTCSLYSAGEIMVQ